MALERLQKFLAAAGIDSRRHSEELIRAGRVAINGQVAAQLGVKVDPARDAVTLDGRPVEPPKDRVYVLLHKPPGYVTTAADEFGRPTVLALLPTVRERVFPVGRLDMESEGLLLLTNDGALAHRLAHPRYGVEREYRALVAGAPTEANLARLKQGIMVQGRHAVPKEVRVEAEVTSQSGKKSLWLRIVLSEGRKREVRELCHSAGYQVLRLIRVGYGPLRLGGLPRGSVRLLTTREVAALQRVTRGDA